MALGKDKQEITIEVSPSKDNSDPTHQDIEQAIHKKLQTEPTELFAHGNTLILTLINEGGGGPRPIKP
jgi:hypothetical protein